MIKTFKICLFFTFILTQNVIGQTIKSEQTIKSYLNSNIGILDPIEGIWGIDEGIMTAYYKGKIAAVQEVPELTGTKVAILKENEKFVVYFEEPDGFIFKKSEHYYTKKGSFGSYYYYTNLYEVKHTFIVNMSDLYSFSILAKYDRSTNKKNILFIQSAREMRERNFNNFLLETKTSYSKIYPTYIEYSSPNTSGKETITGTGFAISSNGYIVTNYHVVENANKIKIRGINGDFNTSYLANISVQDKNNDLVILKILENINQTTLPYCLSSKSSTVGENVFVLGYPLTATMGEEIKLTNGIISSKSGYEGDITVYQITAPVQSGNSGAPLFDKNGYVIGIVNSKHLKAENAGYAIKINYLRNLIDALPNNLNNSNTNILAGKNLSNQVELAKKFIYIIEVE
jgi:S1-C subfamily serine protease